MPRPRPRRRGHHHPYLNVGDAQAGDGTDPRTRDSRRLEGQHGLEICLQVCYSRRHCCFCFFSFLLLASLQTSHTTRRWWSTLLGWRVPVSRSQLGGTAAHGAPSDAAAVLGLAKSQWQVDAAWCLLLFFAFPTRAVLLASTNPTTTLCSTTLFPSTPDQIQECWLQRHR